MNIIVALLLTAAMVAPAAAGQLTGVVIEVADGDTYWIESEERGCVKVRCNGIDAPELAQAFGMESKRALSNAIFGKNATVKYTEKDKYGRYLGDTYVATNNGILQVERALVRYGYAWHFVKYSQSATLNAAEKEARA